VVPGAAQSRRADTASIRSAPLHFRRDAPAHWASYLVNNDASGLSESEKAAADRWLETELEPSEGVIDVSEEPRFTWSFRLYGGDAEGGDVCDYTVI
jgi:hypothetical protein